MDQSDIDNFFLYNNLSNKIPVKAKNVLIFTYVPLHFTRYCVLIYFLICLFLAIWWYVFYHGDNIENMWQLIFAFVDYFQPVKIMRTNTACCIIIFMLLSMYTLYKTYEVIIFTKNKRTTPKRCLGCNMESLVLLLLLILSMSKTLVDSPHYLRMTVIRRRCHPKT